MIPVLSDATRLQIFLNVCQMRWKNLSDSGWWLLFATFSPKRSLVVPRLVCPQQRDLWRLQQKLGLRYEYTESVSRHDLCSCLEALLNHPNLIRVLTARLFVLPFFLPAPVLPSVEPIAPRYTDSCSRISEAPQVHCSAGLPEQQESCLPCWHWRPQCCGSLPACVQQRRQLGWLPCTPETHRIFPLTKRGH